MNESLAREFESAAILLELCAKTSEDLKLYVSNDKGREGFPRAVNYLRAQARRARGEQPKPGKPRKRKVHLAKTRGAGGDFYLPDQMLDSK